MKGMAKKKFSHPLKFFVEHRLVLKVLSSGVEKVTYLPIY
jgi:hypothetical protein